MIGVDTSFLVAWAIQEHPDHQTCRELGETAAADGESFGITAGVLAEFVHVVTDPRRFERPLDPNTAAGIARFWLEAAEVQMLPQGRDVARLWLDWLAEHRLGRKRLLDTLIAATWHAAGIEKIFTLDPGDFTIFARFTHFPEKRQGDAAE